MKKKFRVIDEITKENVLNDYFINGISIRNLKRKYDLFSNEVLTILGQENLKLEDYHDGIIGGKSFVALADTHIGSIYEKKWYYDYLANFLAKYDIRDVIIAGDFLQGIMPQLQEKYKDPKEQTEHAINLIPVNNQVTWHILFGNHDLPLLEENKECYKIIKTRKDFHLLGYRRAYMLFGKNLFSISHKTPNYMVVPPRVNTDFSLYGHGHFEATKNTKIYLPPFCLDTKSVSVGSPYPGFIVARKLPNEIAFFYYIFFEKTNKNTTVLELVKLKESLLEPQEMGKVLSIPIAKK